MKLAVSIGVALGVATPSLFGCGGEISDAPRPRGAASPLTVHFVDVERAPIVGMTALVAGKLTVTDASGSIALDDAPLAYDVTFFAPIGRGTLFAYQGLTQRDVTIGAPVAGAHVVSRAKVTMAPREDGLPVVAFATFGSVRGASPAAQTGAWDIFWSGSSRADVHLQSIAYAEDASGAPRYVATATWQTTLEADADITWTPAWKPLAAADLRTLTAGLVAPPEATTPMAMLGVGTTRLPSTPVGSEGRIVLRVPPIDGGFDLITFATWNGGTIEEIDPNVDVDHPPKVALPDGLAMIAPDDGAADVTPSTELRTSATGPVVTYLVPSTSGDSTHPLPSVNIFSAGAAHIPDFAALGVAKTSGAVYTWSATWSSFFTTIEQMAAPWDGPTRTRLFVTSTPTRTITLR